MSLYEAMTVYEDLLFLRQSWDQSTDEPSLRRTSPILRRLLVEGAYGRAWRSVGLDKEPTVIAGELVFDAGALEKDKIFFVGSFGALPPREERVPVVMMYAAPPDLEPKPAATGQRAVMGLSRFMDGICLILRGERISRRLLITYVANKLGGVHLDVRRDPGRDRALLELDMAHNVVVLEGCRAVYAELVTVGQCLVSSPDVDRFLERARDALLAGEPGAGYLA
jgi:hypothetical protein